jgi:protease-4
MSESNQPQMSGTGPDTGRPPVNLSGLGAPPPPPGYGPGPMLPPPYQPPPRRSGSRWLVAVVVILGVLLIGSVLFNVVLGVLSVGLMSTTNAGAGSNVTEVPYSNGDANQRIVILPITGVIGEDKVRFVHQALEYLKKNKPAAIVLRVESPGGGASASDQIWHEIDSYRTSENLPIVASYGAVAASGGYYVSCGADGIIAEPSTVTGSIGVMFDTFTFQDLLQKIGVAPQVLVASNAQEKDVANDPFRAWTPRDTAAVMPFLDSMHELFIKRVFEGRKRVNPSLTEDQVRFAAHGQAYTAAEAFKLKLIDAEGYLSDAIKQAAAKANIPAGVMPKVTMVQVRYSIFSFIDSSERQPPSARALDGATIRQWLDELATPRIEYRWMPGAPTR